MIKHNLTLVLRNLWNKRIYSFVIILSLVVGFVCSSILIAFLVFETSTDEFHAKGERSYSPYLFSGDEDFLKTIGFELMEGTLPSKENRGSLVNETLVRQFELVDPVGEKTPGTDGFIVGVVKDFTISSFKEQIPPVLISYYENGRAFRGSLQMPRKLNATVCLSWLVWISFVPRHSKG